MEKKEQSLEKNINIINLFQSFDSELDKEFAGLDLSGIVSYEDVKVYTDQWESLSLKSQLKLINSAQNLSTKIKETDQDGYFRLQLFLSNFFMTALQYDRSLNSIQQLKLINKQVLHSAYEVEIKLQLAKIYQLKAERPKALKYLYQADQLIKHFHPDDMRMRQKYQDILIDLNLQNKELIFAHQLLFKEIIFERQNSLDVKLRLVKILLYLEDYVECEISINDILERISQGEKFKKSIQITEFLNVIIYLLLKLEKYDQISEIVDNIQEYILLQEEKKNLFYQNFNPIHLCSILNYLKTVYGIQVNEQVQGDLESQKLIIITSIHQNWICDQQYLNSFDYVICESDQSSNEMGIMNLQFVQLLMDSLIYERVFQATSPANYEVMFGKIIMLLRTAPIDKSVFLLNSIENEF
ncbi:UNKNOWN [Stylonychia lemnae]|uniref:Uncharacterized protein n=1 Tax=Stylonychia lemnae TaxID=5949 RepID=A0A078AM98_STYLE|nr:UNKNOWN [Stylonychia lemnae]|eukprot:CDW83520.1 UNKNOWN [Stylonychia lemnae]